MKRKYLLVMILLSSVSYSAGKISFSEQKKMEKTKKVEEEKVNSTINLESKPKIVLNNQSILLKNN